MLQLRNQPHKNINFLKEKSKEFHKNYYWKTEKKKWNKNNPVLYMFEKMKIENLKDKDFDMN